MSIFMICLLGTLFVLSGMLLLLMSLYGGSPFSNFEIKVYNTFFEGKDPMETAIKLRGQKWYEGYSQDCRVVKKPPEYREICAGFAISAAAMLISGVLSIVAGPLFLYLALPVMVYYLGYKPKRYRRLAKKMRLQIEGELPRFLSLLHTELAVDVPVETAIELISDRMDTLLAKEFKDSYRDMNAGLVRWSDAILDIESRYKVETLTIFARNIVTSYNQGLSIADTIKDISEDVNRARILKIEETAGEVTNIVLLPAAILQLLPMIIFIAFPPFLQLLTMQL